MPDGFKRKRRNRNDLRSRFYAAYRSARFAKRFGGIRIDIRTVCVILVQGEKK